MKLTELEPEFVRYESPMTEVSMIVGDPATWRDRGCPTELRTEPREHIIKVDTLAEAQGLWFLCPACFAKNGGKVGTHALQVGFHGRGLLDSQSSHGKDGRPSRWNVTGTGFGDLSTTPSIDCGCWHGYVTNGEAK